ncbi:MAG: CHAT domain-containing protein [Pyrinomonadaceae bacterium]|nr:CHAT domain-containing protein [Pyrinomonadaceae bacterium]
MRRSELAKRLISAPDDLSRRTLLSENRRLADAKLAGEIRKLCYASWTVEPVVAQRAASAMRVLVSLNKEPSIEAVASWVKGIAAITQGHFETAASKLETAYQILQSLGLEAEAAQTYVAKLLALAMLGRYDEAVRTGEVALSVFVRVSDQLAAGKVEMNLSNIVSRQSLHREAEKYCLSARTRFIKAKETSWLAMAENGLGNTYTELNDFKKAEVYFRSALSTARSAKMSVTEAEIEASLGNLAILRGDLSAALRYLERSRQKYAELDMPHQSAIAELEIADIYAELNLSSEGAEIYERLSPVFAKLKIRAEEARSRLNAGRVSIKLRDPGRARRQLAKALGLFEKEKNESGRVVALLAIAEVELSTGKIDKAVSALDRASATIQNDQNPRHWINLKLCEANAFEHLGKFSEAEEMLSDAYALAKKHQQLDSAQTALNRLGKLASGRGDIAKAKRFFSMAIRQIESLRSSLTDEYSMAFLESRLEPFSNLARLLLVERRFAAAFEMFERGRSRALLDSFDRKVVADKGAKKLTAELGEVRCELNAFYKRLDLAAGEERERLATDIKHIESRIAELSRQIESLGARTVGKSGGGVDTDLRAMQNKLGPQQVLIEFVEANGKFGAFVVSASKIKFFGDLGTATEIKGLIEQLHFQFGTLRYGGEHLTRFASQMKLRADRCLAAIYDLLIRPLGSSLKGKRLVIIPVGALFYVPFQALTDGTQYLIEKFEIATAPSASVWSRLAARKAKSIKKPLLIGFADPRIPLVENEIKTLKKIMPLSAHLTGKAASFAAFTSEAPKHDLIHLACHGQFRPDNPMFSSLHLSDGWVTVKDVCANRLNAELVTLSACETGMNEIFAGEEILGLARGFLTAGASALIVSLWTVSDEAAQKLMSDLYTHLQRCDTPSASLRKAQLGFVRRGEHPYLWSPFTYIGR